MIRLKVVDCVRCGGTHETIAFAPLTKVNEGWSHWSLCPETKEPIMVKVGGGHHAATLPAMRLDADHKEVPVLKCSRCGGEHGVLKFCKVDNAPDEFDHFSVCPTTGQPILATFATIPVQVRKEPPVTAGPSVLTGDDEADTE